jgi:hypothetical protein
VDFFELLAENYLGPSPLPRQHAERVGARYPLVGHGVSLNVAGTDPLNADHLRRLQEMVHHYPLAWFTDHLCWTAQGSHAHHELLPFPYLEEAIDWVADRIRQVQRALGVPFGVENVSTYVQAADEELSEAAFVARVVEAADCGLLLDLNNLWVNAVNHGFDPHSYLDAVPWERVLAVHLAGHQVLPGGLRHDTHDRAVDPAVWSLYAEAWRRGGPFPTLLEWDEAIPPLEVALAELSLARRVRA